MKALRAYGVFTSDEILCLLSLFCENEIALPVLYNQMTLHVMPN